MLESLFLFIFFSASLSARTHFFCSLSSAYINFILKQNIFTSREPLAHVKFKKIKISITKNLNNELQKHKTIFRIIFRRGDSFLCYIFYISLKEREGDGEGEDGKKEKPF